MKRLSAVSLVVFASVLVASGPARAVERQHHLGLAPQLGFLKVDDKSTMSVGGGGALHYAYGLTDQFNLMAEAGSAVVALKQEQDFPDSPLTRPATVSNAAVGVGYVIDILTWVPYFGALAGPYMLTGGTLPETLFVAGAAVAAGLDYQLSRHFAVGVGVRQHFLLTKLSTYPSYTTALLRFEYMWGF
jgi:outer membrane protein with beta-barrel domain